jgi:hypothetical protein
MSQHVQFSDGKKFVYGWDQPLQSFFFQVHDLSLPEDEQIIFWDGATPDTQMYEVEELYMAAQENGLEIDSEMRVRLYGEKDDGV